MNKVISYFQDSMQEFRHVTWPTRQEAINLSIVVGIFMIVTSALFGLIDYALNMLLTLS